MNEGKNAILNRKEGLLQNNEGYTFNSTDFIFVTGLLDGAGQPIINENNSVYKVVYYYCNKSLKDTQCTYFPSTICGDTIGDISSQMGVPKDYQYISYCLDYKNVENFDTIRLQGSQRMDNFTLIGAIQLFYVFQTILSKCVNTTEKSDCLPQEYIDQVVTNSNFYYSYTNYQFSKDLNSYPFEIMQNLDVTTLYPKLKKYIKVLYSYIEILQFQINFMYCYLKFNSLINQILFQKIKNVQLIKNFQIQEMNFTIEVLIQQNFATINKQIIEISVILIVAYLEYNPFYFFPKTTECQSIEYDQTLIDAIISSDNESQLAQVEIHLGVKKQLSHVTYQTLMDVAAKIGGFFTILKICVQTMLYPIQFIQYRLYLINCLYGLRKTNHPQSSSILIDEGLNFLNVIFQKNKRDYFKEQNQIISKLLDIIEIAFIEKNCLILCIVIKRLIYVLHSNIFLLNNIILYDYHGKSRIYKSL